MVPFLLNASHITYQSRTTLHNIHYTHPYEQSGGSLIEFAHTSTPHYLASILTTCPLDTLPIGLISVTDVRGVYYVHATHAVSYMQLMQCMPWILNGMFHNNVEATLVTDRISFECNQGRQAVRAPFVTVPTNTEKWAWYTGIVFVVVTTDYLLLGRHATNVGVGVRVYWSMFSISWLDLCINNQQIHSDFPMCFLFIIYSPTCFGQ